MPRAAVLREPRRRAAIWCLGGPTCPDGLGGRSWKKRATNSTEGQREALPRPTGVVAHQEGRIWGREEQERELVERRSSAEQQSSTARTEELT